MWLPLCRYFGARVGPKTLSVGPKRAQDAPRRPQDLPKTPKIEAKISPKTSKFWGPTSRPKILAFFVQKSMILAMIFYAFLTSLSHHLCALLL